MRKVYVAIGLLIFLLFGCQAGGPSGSTAIQLTELSDTSLLLEQLEDLEAGLSEAETREQIFQVSMAHYVLETADFHAIDESINDQGVIQPEFLGTTDRVQIVLNSIDWPEELHEDLQVFQSTLAYLSQALSEDDLESTGQLAFQAHKLQLNLSHSIGAWLAGNTSSSQEV